MIKKKGQYSKFIVAAVIILNIIFTASVLYVFTKTGSEPSSLIAAWFTFTTGELFMLTSIKKNKVKKEKKEE
jgi:hydrogenase-4 membrane subunit HyfE